MNVGKAVIWVREQRGYGVKELSNKLGWAHAQLWKVERRGATERTLKHLCKGLRIDVEVLYYLTLVFETEGKMMEMGVDITPLLIYHLEKKYGLELNEIVGI